MPRLRPFRGVRYSPSAGSAETLTAPPYDVISPMDRERLYEASAYNVVRLILGRDEPDDDDRRNRYTRARAFLERWLADGILVRSTEPCVYPYEVSFRWAGRPHRIRGVIAEIDLEPWGGSIVPHERTMSGPVQDRLSLLRAVGA